MLLCLILVCDVIALLSIHGVCTAAYALAAGPESHPHTRPLAHFLHLECQSVLLTMCSAG